MRCNILAIGLYEPYLKGLTQAVWDNGCRIVPAANLGVASWLLTQRKFSLVLIGLECFIDCTLSFAYEVTSLSLPVVVLGTAGMKYEWRIEQIVDLFVSYDIPPRELVRRVERLLLPADYTASSGHDSEPIVKGDFFVDQENGLANICGKTVSLSREELVLLCYFLRHANRLISFQMVCTELWLHADCYGRDERPIVEALRRKMEPVPDKPIYLQDVPDIGYWFQEEKDGSLF